MTIPAITATITPPLVTDSLAEFNAKAFAAWVDLSALAPEINDVTEEINNAVSAAATSAQTATDKEALTNADAIATGQDRVQTGLDRAAAIALGKRYLGAKAAAPTVDNDGAPLLTGAVYYDTSMLQIRVWAGSAWVQGVASGAGVASYNGQTGDVVVPPTQFINYDDRGALRSQSPTAGELAIVKGLGLFVWESASTEPDDDESAFATTSGVWLLEAVAWDVVSAWQSPDDAVRDEDDEDEPLRFADSFAAKILTGSATCTITSVGPTGSASFTGTVTGAALGDRVVATPPDQLGATSPDTGKLSYHAWVSSANTVTVMLTNANNSTSATTNTAIQTAWPISVIKS
jgi:hypothetical protein